MKAIANNESLDVEYTNIPLSINYGCGTYHDIFLKQQCPVGKKRGASDWHTIVLIMKPDANMG